MSALDSLREFDEWVADDFLKPKPNSSLETYEVHFNYLIGHIRRLPKERRVGLKAALRELARTLESAIRRELNATAIEEARKVLGEE